MDLFLETSDHFPIRVSISKSNVNIVDSYRVKDDKEKISFISAIKKHDPDVWESRSDASLLAEWKAHNALYKHGKWVSHTKDVDLESKQSFFYRIAWFFVNILYKE